MPKTFDTECVGMQYRVTMSTRHMIQRHIEKDGPIEIMLVREHDNVHDENAIKVVIRYAPYKGMHIGYLPRHISSVYAPALDGMKTYIRRACLTRVNASEGNGDLRIVVGKRAHPKLVKKRKTA